MLQTSKEWVQADTPTAFETMNRGTMATEDAILGHTRSFGSKLLENCLHVFICLPPCHHVTETRKTTVLSMSSPPSRQQTIHTDEEKQLGKGGSHVRGMGAHVGSPFPRGNS